MKNCLLCFFILMCFIMSLPYLPYIIPSGVLELRQDRELAGTTNTFPCESIRVKCHDGIIRTVTPDEYVKGTLYACLPDDAPYEFVCAMAVAVRTYAVYHTCLGDKTEKHPLCDMCSEPTHCRSFAYGKTSIAIDAAVADTQNELIVYKKQIINPLFHLSSAVQTESALTVFGTDIPYLQSVSTPDESSLDCYFGKEEFTWSETSEILAEYGYIMAGDYTDWITYISYTEGGRIKNIGLGGYNVKGTELAAMFGLASANISIKTVGMGFVFETEGIGHGVGLSEYGALLMAQSGKSYREILAHYYPGTYIG